MSEVKPLYLHGWEPEDVAVLRAVKPTLDIPFQVKPVVAVWGQQGRVLALKNDPDWLCDSITLPSSKSVNVGKAFLWACGLLDLPHVESSYADKLSSWIGGPVAELEPENLRTVFFE